MRREEIVEKLAKIKKSVMTSNCAYIKNRANQREFQIFSPNRFKFLSPLIRKIRSIIVKEIDHAIEPELDKQREINLRLVKEIELLRKELNRPDSKQI
jgi:hypothetical protein